jgi:hypothetical protein
MEKKYEFTYFFKGVIYTLIVSSILFAMVTILLVGLFG